MEVNIIVISEFSLRMLNDRKKWRNIYQCFSVIYSKKFFHSASFNEEEKEIQMCDALGNVTVCIS